MFPRKFSLRFGFVFLFFILSLLVFAIRLTLIQIFNSQYLADLARKQHNHLIKLEPRRGTIFDRNQRPLALNLPAYSLVANTKVMTDHDKDKVVEAVAPILSIDPGTLRNQLHKERYFVWIARKMPQDKYKAIKDLKLHGLDFVKESKRIYPNQYLASHIIGFAGIDNIGLEGMELRYDHYLRGKDGFSQLLRDARQRDLLIEKNYVPPQDGFNLTLTIDETIQFLAEKALDEAYRKYHAKGATIIVMNPKTGEILAFANRPTYNLEDHATSSAESRTNRGVAFTYEPGSVFKIVTASGALQENVVKETDDIFCENGSYRVGNHVLHDAHAKGHLTFREVIEESSNIGTVKVAQRLGPEKVYDYAHRFRFGIKTGLEVPGEVGGTLKAVSRWSKTSIGAVPIGQEVTVTPLQLICALSAIANHGVYMKPYILKMIRDEKDQVIESFEPKVVDRVITEETAKRVTEILKGVVEEGTGTKAKIPGVAVAGKTGTAQKVENGTYSHNRFYSTFMGYAPADNPRLAAVVVLDEPVGAYYGGTVCAPAFQQVVADSLKYLDNTGSE